MTEPSHLAAVRESYDTVADDYVSLVKNPSELDPLSRSMLTAFAELVQASGRGPVADLGCGPGRVTAHLAGLGVSAFGVDVSPKMIELARSTYPDLSFSVGSMTALEIGDDTLGGILVCYSTHHTPPELLPVVFAEFHRTLAPGGHLLLGRPGGDPLSQTGSVRTSGCRPVRRHGVVPCQESAPGRGGDADRPPGWLLPSGGVGPHPADGGVPAYPVACPAAARGRVHLHPPAGVRHRAACLAHP
ncbi:hypothetical protein GCM10010358_23990 [Streptomyces minutiscleroticus]|uniref:Methyltransferase domain-containing protein n=1 Tax=Streptomyces minutiscleroticus TaxID=68238 RepID=A0A918NGI3_9ACTN|nr:class I SAM-dependent methyltransferase [Streptomyces minutiscleroticus]GGX68845.1 hypothetical protein GCM10010358_23990 [Streptomyces minutiscleroticus]